MPIHPFPITVYVQSYTVHTSVSTYRVHPPNRFAENDVDFRGYVELEFDIVAVECLLLGKLNNTQIMLLQATDFNELVEQALFVVLEHEKHVDG